MQPCEARKCGAAACETKKLPFAVAPNAASQSAFVELLERLRRETLAGGVHEQVETAELLDRPRDERPRLLGREVAVGAAGREHRPTVALEPRGDRGADPPGTPRDQSTHARK